VPRKATVRARGLGAELKELRNRAGLNTRQVGALMNSSTATVSRIETGQRGVTSEEVAAMMVIYKATPEERDRLVALAKEVDRPGWWETDDSSLPKPLNALIGFEAQATRITDVAMLLVPGLLQTTEYARAVMTASGASPGLAESRIVTRMGRQAALTRPDAPQLVAFIDEAVVRRPLASDAVMAEQARRLIEAGERANVTIRIMSFARGGHPAVNGSFSVLEFAKASTIVHLEHMRSSAFVDDTRNVKAFLEAVDILGQTALSPAESAQFLAGVGHEFLPGKAAYPSRCRGRGKSLLADAG
jgi:transcriptional regulator with XRE-family HTH domain